LVHGSRPWYEAWTSLSFNRLVRDILINRVPSVRQSKSFALSKRRKVSRRHAHPEDTRRISTETHTYAHPPAHVTARTQNVGTHGMRTDIFTLALPRTGASRLHQVDRRAIRDDERWRTSATDFGDDGELCYARNAIFGRTAAAPCVDQCSTCVSSLNRHGDPFLSRSPGSSPIQSFVVRSWGPRDCNGSRTVAANNMAPTLHR